MPSYKAVLFRRQVLKLQLGNIYFIATAAAPMQSVCNISTDSLGKFP